MNNNTEKYYSAKQGRLPLFFSDCLDICDPVLAFDRIMEEIEIEKYLKPDRFTASVYRWLKIRGKRKQVYLGLEKSHGKIEIPSVRQNHYTAYRNERNAGIHRAEN